MKTNLILGGVLVLFLSLTWLLTEKRVFNEVPAAEQRLQAALKDGRHIKLPNAELTQDNGVWRLADGEMVKAEYLQELSKSLEQVKIFEVISAKAPGFKREDFFTHGLDLQWGELKLKFGDLTATGESFYFSVDGDPDVLVINLQEMSSMAVADEDKILQQEKYNRLRDLILLPSERWREKRLGALAQSRAFKTWSAGGVSLTAAQLRGKPWGETLVQALQAGITSLEVNGPTLHEKPKTHAKIDDWIFTLEDGTVTSWEFYAHPSLEIIYVWMPRLNRAYPLNQSSSDFIRDFVPRLVNRPFPLKIFDRVFDEATLREGKLEWKVTLNRKREEVFSPKKINQENASAILDFFSTTQTFDYLTLLTPKDCKGLNEGARFHVKIDEDWWGILPIKGGLVFLECETQVALTWSLPLDSAMDFATLQVKQ